MIVFGYGSLMWDEWETKFACARKEVATLPGFHRDFNKASVRNWGTKEAPGPTLGLRASTGAECQGMAFEFPDAQRSHVLEALREREGPSFSLSEEPIVLASGTRVTAVVPVNKSSAATFIGNKSLGERARMARVARGNKGSCANYVKSIHTKLQELNIQDPAVEEFARLVSE